MFYYVVNNFTEKKHFLNEYESKVDIKKLILISHYDRIEHYNVIKQLLQTCFIKILFVQSKNVYFIQDWRINIRSMRKFRKNFQFCDKLYSNLTKQNF